MSLLRTTKNKEMFAATVYKLLFYIIITNHLGMKMIDIKNHATAVLIDIVIVKTIHVDGVPKGMIKNGDIFDNNRAIGFLLFFNWAIRYLCITRRKEGTI